ncbi:Uncharacterized membrane protein [Sporobacter termitidis DSM 10068]|uniref:Uncharacterized membrane protein n=1 Tax=Sporobacter termitidis DSM 10068 TaxID=1123282 RepID=A0A1M5YW07_9FIRM|nr:DUF1700 domain-containing protein [Sporobacter termitidis]SHI16165.1 Uncharacterized membrane protein [Sporobacter termitidis DSM 10068]
MNKHSYLNELKNQLKARNVEDIDELLAEYDEHFTRKMADGYTEEEIAAKLGKPAEIALQFASVGTKAEGKGAGKLVVGIGLAFADIFVASFFIVLSAWVLVLGAAAVASALCGVCLLLGPLLPQGIVFIPPMPYFGAVFLAVALIAFGVLLAVAAVYSWALAVQLCRAYRRWHKNMLSGGKYPPLAKHPMLKDVPRRRLRSAALIALVAFGVSFVIGYIVLSIGAGALEFWHVWHWFQ